MAKWGEGDPRWIVEERSDATNVNNWHWTEKNASSWSVDKITSLLQGLQIEDDKYSCEITEVTKVDGEASASNRKGKLIFFYEWVIQAQWKGRPVGDKTSYKGKLDIPNLSEEQDAEDIDVQVSVTDGSDEAYKVKEFMRTTGGGIIRNQLANYICDLKQVFSESMILPTKDKDGHKPNTKPAPVLNTAKKELTKPVIGNLDSTRVRIPCKKIKTKVEFKCRAPELYRALTEKEMVSAFTRGEARIEAVKGGRFVLFDGNVTGDFTNLVQNEKLEMHWHFKSWPDDHYSNVQLILTEKEDCTELELIQTGVPENEYDRTKEGWVRYYWEPIKQTFGFGARLF